MRPSPFQRRTPHVKCLERHSRCHLPQRPHHHAGSRQAAGQRRGHQGRPLRRRRHRRRGHGAGRARHPARRPQAAQRPARPVRQPHACGARRPELQHGTALGRRALAGRRHGDAQAPGRHHAGAAMGAGGGRVHRAPVRREAPADDRGDQRHRARHAGVPAAPVRPRPAQRRRAARGGLHQDHAQPAGRRDHPRRAGQPHRAAPGQAERDHPVRHAGQGPQAAVRLPGQFHAPFHARAEPPGRDRRDRRGGAVSRTTPTTMP